MAKRKPNAVTPEAPKTRTVRALTFRLVEMAERFPQASEFVDPISNPAQLETQIKFPLFSGEMTMEVMEGESVVWAQGGTSDQTIRRVNNPNGDGTMVTKIYSVQAILAREQEFEVPIEQETEEEGEAVEIILPREASTEAAQSENRANGENSGEAENDPRSEED